MNKQTALTRTCSACGIEKPLAAFLQVSGTQGSRYGNLCSACRGAGIQERHANLIKEEERSSTSSGVRIGAKQKIDIDKEKKRQFQKLKETHQKISKKREKIGHEKSELLHNKEQSEKYHRTHYIDAKRAFLNFQTKKPAINDLKRQTKTDALFKRPLFTENKTHFDRETAKLEAAIQHEQRITMIDLSGAPVLDQQHAVISRDNPIFKRFLAWLGTSAPIMQTLNQLNKQGVASVDSKSHSVTEKDPIIDYINNTWGPSSGRSR